MRLRGISAVLATVAVAAVPAPHSDAARHFQAGCRPANSQTVTHSRYVRVFTRRVREESNNRGYEIKAFGCLFSTGRAYSLGLDDVGLNSYASHFRIAGPFVGYALGDYDDFGNQADRVRVVDLRTGKTVHSSRAFTGPTRGGIDAEELVTVSLVLKRYGAVAWIGAYRAEDGDEDLPPRFEVHRIDSRGTRLLDSGEAIRPRSLRLRGATITWQNAGRQRHASLR